MLGWLMALGAAGVGGWYGGEKLGWWGGKAAPPPATGKAPAGPGLPPPGVLPQPPDPSPPPGYTGPLPPFDLTYPGAGAWDTNGAYIGQYQGALTYLAAKLGKPQWDPGGVDEHYGPKTKAAVQAFQTDHGLTVDGEAGPSTDQALDAALALVPQ